MDESSLKSDHRKNPSATDGSLITLADMFRIARRRKKGIIISMILSVAGTFAWHVLQPPEFRAVSIMMINPKQDQGDLFSKVLGSGMMENQLVKKDAELICSMSIAEKTIKVLHQNPFNKSLEILGGKEYISPFAMIVQPFFPLFAANGDDRNLNYPASVRKASIELNRRIKVEPVRDTNVMKISVASPFAEESAYLTDILCRVYRDDDISRNSEKYAQANRFIAEMLVEQQQKVNEADDALSRYMLRHEIYEVTANTRQLLEKLIEVDARYNELMAEYNITRNGLDFLDKKLSENEKELSMRIAKNVSVQLGSIMDEIRSAENEYALLLRTKGPDDVESKSKRQQLDVVKERYDQLSRSKIAGQIGYAGKTEKYSFDMVSEKLQIERKLNELNFSAREYNRLKQYYEAQLSRLPVKAQQYVRLERDREAVSKTYVFLKEKLDESRILMGSEVGSVAIIGPAFLPPEPEFPNIKTTLIMGLLIGSVIAGAYTYRAETMDDTVRDISFFRNIGSGKIFSVPFVSALNRSAVFQRGEKQATGKLVSGFISGMQDVREQKYIESIRMIRTHLDFLDSTVPVHSILVSGTREGEGKSTICADLGIAYSRSGRKTVIVDCDLMHASMHELFDCERTTGLSDYLLGEGRVSDPGFIKHTSVDNLSLVSAGREVSENGELFNVAMLTSLLQELTARFERVLLDAPSLFVSDSLLLAQMVDRILIVSRTGYTCRTPLTELMTDEVVTSRMFGFAVIDASDAPVARQSADKVRKVSMGSESV